MKERMIRVVHSSLGSLLRVGIDAEFPGLPSSVGVIIKRGETGSANLSIHTPKLSSIMSGECLEKCGDKELDARLRSEISSLAATCRELAQDLLSHVERLENRLKDETLIFESPVETLEEAFLASKNRAREEERESSKPVSKTVLNLDLFS